VSTSPFEEAIRAAAPDLHISNDPLPSKPPKGYTHVSFETKRTSTGCNMTICIGRNWRRETEFSSEAEAGAFIGNLFKLVNRKPE
jgi:hypothetical protein